MSPTFHGIGDRYDVVVIGGGPAGATLAGVLSRRGRRVIVLERERFPRYHVGESLIPGFMRAMDELGLLEQLEARGFEKKNGGTLVWGAQKLPWGFSFVDGSGFTHSYHVRRADLDAMILDRARELGAVVLEEATVRDTVEEDDRVVGLRYTVRGSEATAQEVRATLVIDASGQARVLGRKYSDIVWHEDMRNVAVWTYFDNCARLPGDEHTNVLIEGLEGGWFWAIPVGKTTLSVGFVTASADASESGQSLEELYTAKLAETSQLKELLREAHQSSGFRSARDWSYTCERFHGPGWALVGDSAAFVDPLFSTGVALATLAAIALSGIVDKILDCPEIEEAALDRYATAYHAFFDEIRRFVAKFDDRTRQKEFYWAQAQDIVDPERVRSPRENFVRLVSGMSGQHPLFNIDVDDLMQAQSTAATIS